MVSFAEVYADESYRKKSSPYLTIAGYVFRRRGAREFTKAWGPYLNRRMGYAYYHQTDMVGHRDIFGDCDADKLDQINRKLITLTRKWSAFGFAVTVHEADYEAKIGGRWGLPPNAFGFALLQAMIMVRRWADRASFEGQISYFFEEGNAHEGEAATFLTQLIKKSPTNRERYRFRTHAFLPKETHWLHPADFLAWHWSQERMRQSQVQREHPVRMDLIALLNGRNDMTMDYNPANIAALATELTLKYGAREPDWQTFNWEAFRRLP